jgi:hypothetical protein
VVGNELKRSVFLSLRQDRPPETVLLMSISCGKLLSTAHARKKRHNVFTNITIIVTTSSTLWRTVGGYCQKHGGRCPPIMLSFGVAQLSVDDPQRPTWPHSLLLLIQQAPVSRACEHGLPRRRRYASAPRARACNARPRATVKGHRAPSPLQQRSEGSPQERG